ncbi:Crp/Fnr family transcriptional regulator [Fusobacterium sp. IOR10]|uniref:Crp/Fnr family transcriptional regulator n=1 Tax=Fusobacterium sp. IOR10 TaxID=2665157 RepID=UPI0013CFAA1E|nr:Crp/Fnr family transcriptional regulator [Fusobacterium sp. IOR10]
MNKEYSVIFNLDKQNNMRNFFLNVLVPYGKITSYEKQNILSIDVVDSLYIVVSGEVQISLCEENGDEQLIYTLCPGEILGEFEIFSQIPESYNLYFITDVKICKINKNEIDKILLDHPNYYPYFIHSMSRKYHLALFQMSFNKFYVNEERILEFLIRIAVIREPNKEENVEVLGYTHENIGNALNISRIGVTKILTKLQEKNLIVTKRKLIKILSVPKLINYRKSVKKS